MGTAQILLVIGAIIIAGMLTVQMSGSLSNLSDIDLYNQALITANKIIQADSGAFKFCADLDNNSTVDTVYYYSGLVTALPTPNPNDKELFRKINNNTAVSIAYVRNYKFTYSDSTGIAIPYGTLSTQAGRNTIEYITCYLKFESSDSSSGSYSPVEWKKKFRPKNL